jgi:hypothetical protein
VGSRLALAAKPNLLSILNPSWDLDPNRFDRVLAALNRQLCLAAEHSGGKRHGNLVFKIDSPLGRGAPPAGATTLAKLSEEIGETAASPAAEEVFKIDFDALSARRAAGPSPRPAAVSARLFERRPIAIVHLTFFRIVEHIECGLNLLELLLRLGVVRIEIRVVFSRKLAVGLANIIGRRGAGDAQSGVVVFGHRG